MVAKTPARRSRAYLVVLPVLFSETRQKVSATTHGTKPKTGGADTIRFFRGAHSTDVLPDENHVPTSLGL